MTNGAWRASDREGFEQVAVSTLCVGLASALYFSTQASETRLKAAFRYFYTQAYTKKYRIHKLDDT